MLAGGSGWSDEVNAAIAAVPAHLRLVRPGYLHFTDLPGFLGGALVVAFPSTGEGFGLPALEAMACGAPVLTTHITSLPEVGGDAVAYTEPDAPASRRRCEHCLMTGAPGGLGVAGYARALEFTWAASAEAHMASYERERPRDGGSVAAHAERFRPLGESAAGGSGAGEIEAILLVGGQGTRLRPLTIATPKPLLPTAGVPFLAHQLARAAAAGITRVFLATAYRADMFATQLGDGSQFGLRLDWSHEDQPLGTGGGIRNAAAGCAAARTTPLSCSTATSCPATTSASRSRCTSRKEAAVTLHLTEVPTPPGSAACRPLRRQGDRVPGEDPEPGHQPDQCRAATSSPVR